MAGAKNVLSYERLINRQPLQVAVCAVHRSLVICRNVPRKFIELSMEARFADFVFSFLSLLW